MTTTYNFMFKALRTLVVIALAISGQILSMNAAATYGHKPALFQHTHVYVGSDMAIDNSTLNGGVAVGGTAQLTETHIQNRPRQPFKRNMLIANGRLTYSSGSITNGGVRLGGRNNVIEDEVVNSMSRYARITERRLSKNTFPLAHKKQERVSEWLAGQADNGSIEIDGNTLTLNGDCTSTTQYFSISADALASVTGLNYSCLFDDMTVIMNIRGDSAQFFNFDGSMLQDFARTTVLNFIDASSISLTDSTIYGVILAPNTSVTSLNSSVYGQVALGNLYGEINILGSAFNGRFKKSSGSNGNPSSGLNCDNAYATPSTLAPKDDRFVLVDIKGVTSSKSKSRRSKYRKQPEITVNCVTQDEEVGFNDDGTPNWDAKLISKSASSKRTSKHFSKRYSYSSKKGSYYSKKSYSKKSYKKSYGRCNNSGDVKLRRQSDIGGNGRVYEVKFTATLNGESCQGSVKVSVGGAYGEEAIDDGQFFASNEESMQCVGGGNQNRPPVITSTPVTQVFGGDFYAYDVEATDADGDTLTYSLLDAPEGMTIDASTGLIEWPTSRDDQGSHYVTVLVSDGMAEATQTYKLKVICINRAPEFVTDPGKMAEVGIEYVYAFNAIDPDGDPLTYTLVRGPEGMTIDTANQTLNWTPAANQVGNFEVVIRVEDPFGLKDAQCFTVTVKVGVNNAPVFITSPGLTANAGEEYVYNFDADDIDGDVLTYSFITLPEGMVFDPVAQTLTWTPTAEQAGLNAVSIKVEDPAEASDTQIFNINVEAANQPPVFDDAVCPVATFLQLQPLTIEILAVDPEGGNVTYDFVSGPASAEYDSATNIITWIANTSETVGTDPSNPAIRIARFEFLATDEQGAATPLTCDVKVIGR